MQHPTMPPPQPPRPPGYGTPPRAFTPTCFKLGRLLGLLAIAAVLLIGSFLVVLFVHGKQRTEKALEAVTASAWVKKTAVHPETPAPKAEAEAAAHDPNAGKWAEMMAKLAALDAKVNDLAKRKAGTTTTVVNQSTQKAATVPTKPKAAAPFFVAHELKETPPPSSLETYTLAPGATKLPCVVETRIVSDVEGYFTCRVSTNVFDTATGRHLLVPQGSTVLGNDQANDLIYGSNRMDTISLTLTLPDGRTVDLGRAPVTDQEGVAGLTGKIDRHFWSLFGAVFIGGALKGGMTAMQTAMTDAAGAGQVATGIGTLGNQATNRVIQPFINIRPTITVEAGQLANVLLTKPLSLPAMWQGGPRAVQTVSTQGTPLPRRTQP